VSPIDFSRATTSSQTLIPFSPIIIEVLVTTLDADLLLFSSELHSDTPFIIPTVDCLSSASNSTAIFELCFSTSWASDVASTIRCDFSSIFDCIDFASRLLLILTVEILAIDTTDFVVAFGKNVLENSI